MGCGKSTVAQFFREFNDVATCNADDVAKELLCEERHAQKLSELLGKEIFTGDSIDRHKVARVVFHDPQALQKLERFIHPLTWQVICDRVKKYTKISFFLVEGALIYEAGWQNYFHAIIVVTCSAEEQTRRLQGRGNVPEEEIAQRLLRQLPSEEKVKRADFVIDTTCSLKEVSSKVRDLYHQLIKRNV